jgi:hypothetical protein
VKTAPNDTEKWQARLGRSGYFVGAILFHVILFLLLATYIVFRPPPVQVDATSFTAPAIKPPPPPTPPAPSGGEAANNFEPTTEVTPPPSAPSVVSTTSPNAFALKAVSVQLPNLPPSMSTPTGSALTGHDTAGAGAGAGNPFGTADSNGVTQLEGYLYDLKQTPDRKPTNIDNGAYANTIKQFVNSNWDPAVLSHFYKSPTPLHTTSIFIPIINAIDGPKAFGVEKEVEPDRYCIWYKVTASPPQDGTYHFVGTADDILVVRVNHRTVLDGCDYPTIDDVRNKETKFNQTGFNPTFPNNADFWVGLPFHASARDSLDIDILIGEQPGGRSDYFLYIQRDEDNDSYAKQSNGSPLLPIFQLDAKPIVPSGKQGTFPPFASTPAPWSAGSSQ